jgi:hypothetical protein
MLSWLKKLFGIKKQEPLVLTNPDKYEDEVVVIERPPAPTPTKSKKAAAKKVPAKTESKRGRKKSGVTKTDLNNMNKDQLEAYAKKEFGVDLDKRRKKPDLVAEVLKLSKK